MQERERRHRKAGLATVHTGRPMAPPSCGLLATPKSPYWESVPGPPTFFSATFLTFSGPPGQSVLLGLVLITPDNLHGQAEAAPKAAYETERALVPRTPFRKEQGGFANTPGRESPFPSCF